MKYLLLLLAFGVMAQEPDPTRHDKYASDKDAFCMAGPPLPSQAVHGHECHCAFMCSPHVDGDDQPPSRIEDNSCALYCSKNRCLCHAEQTCDEPVIEAPK